MIVLDVNVLIYAHNTRAEQHERDRRWLREVLGGTRQLGLPVVTSLGFVRIITDPRAMEPPVPVLDALAMLERIRAARVVVDVNPTEGHWGRIAELAQSAQLRGAAMTDVHLAALALERGAALATHDRGFRRFPELQLVEPGS